MFCGSKKSTKRSKVKLDTISLSSVETNQCSQEERCGVGRITQGMLAHCHQPGLPVCRQDQFYPHIDSEQCSVKTGQLSHFSSGTSGIGSSAMGSEFSSRLGSRTSSKCGRCGLMNPNIPYPGPYAIPPNFMQGPTSDFCESNSDRSRSNNGISGPESDIFDTHSSVQGQNQMLLPPSQPMHTVPTQPMHTRPINAVAAHMQRLLSARQGWTQSESSFSTSTPFIPPDSNRPDEILVGLLRDLENYQQNGCMCGDKYCDEYGSQDSLSTIDSMKPTKEWVFGPETARVAQAQATSDAHHLNRTCLSDDTYATSEYSDTTSVYSSYSDDDESDFTDHMVVDSGSAWHMYVANRDAQTAPTRIPAAFEGRRVIWTKGMYFLNLFSNFINLIVNV